MTRSGPSLFLASSSWILVKAVVSGIVTHAAAPLPTHPGHAEHLQNIILITDYLPAQAWTKVL